jgi:aminopeptidase N
MKLRFIVLYLLLTACHWHLQAQTTKVPSRIDTLKGSITEGRKWWDLKHYDLSITTNINQKSITGRNRISFETVERVTNYSMQIDLQAPLIIDSAIFDQKRAPISKEEDAWFIKLPDQKYKSQHVVDIYYSGKPKESLNPPWDGGVSWTTDSLGRPWITLGAQLVGASVWFPCKEHQSDEPEQGASISITVPDTLQAVANGRMTSQIANGDGTATYKWSVVSPINNYGIAFYIGEYTRVPISYKGIKGNLDTDYWVLDYNVAKVKSYLKLEVEKTLKTFEYWFGAYPFYEDSFKLVEAPYPGMEHQSAVAYGNGFKYGRVKFNNLGYWDLQTDRLVVHEIAHEWFGNNITVNDITENWIHEGFAGFAEELFIENQYGKKASKEFFEFRTIGKTKNLEPLIGRYGIFETGGSYMYLRGWKLIHMLRTIIDDDKKFRSILQGLSAKFYHKTINSKDVEAFISRKSGKDFIPLFDQYLRNKEIPTFEYKLTGNKMLYRYNDCISGFEMPIKTSLTKGKWLQPTLKWKSVNLLESPKLPLYIDTDFNVNVNRLK